MSHLLKAKIGKIQHLDQLEEAVKECQGEWLGHKTLPTYGGDVTGQHFQLYDIDKNGKKTKWRYTCAVRDSDNELVYDNYGGVWGNSATLNKVVQLYARNCAKQSLKDEGFNFGSETVDEKETITLKYWRD